jgi:hypothetical protein
VKVLRWMWAPFGLMLRAVAWVLVWPLGLVLSWRKGRNRRHRQLVAATRAQAAATRNLAAARSYPPHQWTPGPGPYPPPPPPPPPPVS